MPSVGRDDAVTIWRIALDEVDLIHAPDVLHRDELLRADSLATPALRRRFLSRRTALRQILGNELGIEPAKVAIGLSARGKPHLSDRSGLFFNVSHSGTLGLLALGAGGELGIDIETVREVPHWTDIVREFFDETERELLLGSDRPALAFLSHWTRKEAVAKATGFGLELPLGSFAVTNASGAETFAVTVPGPGGTACRWHVRDVMAGPDHIAALASSRACGEIIWQRFPEHGGA